MTRTFVALAFLLGLTGCFNQTAKEVPDTPYKRLQAKGVKVGRSKLPAGKEKHTVILQGVPLADVWDDVCQLRGIDQLTMRVDNLSAEILRGIGQLKEVDDIHIEIAGPGTCTETGWEELKKLKTGGEVTFNLFEIPLSREAVEGIVQIPNLTELGFRGCSLSDDMLTPLVSVKKLTSLNVAENDKLTDAGIKKLTALTNLTWLDLSFTQLTDEGLMELAALKQLEHLEVSYTRVTPAGVERFRKANPMCGIIE